MRILYIVGAPSVRLDSSVYMGSTSHIVNLIRAFHKIGNEVIPIIAGESNSAREARLSYTNLKHFLHPSLSSVAKDVYKIAYNYKFLSSYKYLFKTKPPDFIYERQCDLFWAGSTIAKRLKIPYILEINGPVEARRRFGPAHSLFLSSVIQRRIEKCAHAIVTVSKAMRKYLVRRGVPFSKIRVLPNGVDPDFFASRSSGQTIRSRYGLRGKGVVGFLGSMKKYHGVELFTRLAEMIVTERPGIHFLIVGPFEDREQFEIVLEEKGLSGHFTLTGGVPYEEVPAHIAAMDICVMPNSNWNGSPIKIFEYGALGKPIIAPRVGPVQEVIEDSKNGLLINPGDVDDLKEKVLMLLDNPSLREEFGRRIREHIVKHHTWRKNAERIMEIHRSIR